MYVAGGFVCAGEEKKEGKVGKRKSSFCHEEIKLLEKFIFY